MADCALIGDELTGLGFRLAGVTLYHPSAQDLPGLFRRLRNERTPLIMLTAEMAAALPNELLHEAWQAHRPLVLVIPDIRGRVLPPDLADQIRHHLGMAE